ncbi:MAG: FtsW/RodA/SpoVE family cell cycle protein [Clostridia bacterium]|nr:FtsW/RodA/SpoVE family cell cycle protein [Clostridia bacterium]
MASITPEAYRKRMTRAYELPLLYMVMLFQFASMLLLTFRDGSVEPFSLLMSVCLPVGTFLGLKILSRLFYADRCIYILVAFLCSLGVILLRAVLKKETDASDQAVFVGVGFLFMLIGAFVGSRNSLNEKFLFFMMPVCLGVMCLPFVFTSSSAANNWVRIGSIQFQPSEIMKPVLIVMLAKGFSDKSGWRKWIVYILFSVLACGILFRQPDLGSLFIFFFITVCMFFVGTGNWKVTVFVLALAAGGVAVFLSILDKVPAFEYLASRIAIWKNPWNGEYENARQIVQGLISIASGGYFGAGLGLGSADRVAVVSSDYIFAALAEEFGTPFSILVLGVYLLILIRSTQIAMNARSRYHALLSFGSVFALTIQMLLIVAGNLHILPLTGVTLPFVSAGGSSILASMTMAGLILGVSSVNAEDEYDDLMRLSDGRWRDE